MARRIRSVLVDNTLGKIFTGVNSSATVNPSNLIAGSTIKSTSFSAAATARAIVAQNIGVTSGIAFAATSLIVQVVLIASGSAPVGSPITLVLKKGTDYKTASTVETYTLPSNSKTITYNISGINISAGERIFADITTVGNQQPGYGFGFQLGYYSS